MAKNAAHKLAIIAGGGVLPGRVAAAARAQGRDIFIIGLEGFADPAVIAPYPHKMVRLGALGQFLDTLKHENCHEVVMIGAVTRPDLKSLRPDFLGMRLLPRIAKLMGQGDDALLTGIVRWLENEHGIKVIAPDAVAPDLVSTEGTLTKAAPSVADEADIRLAAGAAEEIGRADKGQGAIAVAGHVVAREEADGTNAMLERVALDRKGVSQGGVLVKLSKPAQETRVDLPTIGPETVARAAAAGLAGIAVEAGGTLIAERDNTVAAADAAGLFVVVRSRQALLGAGTATTDLDGS